MFAACHRILQHPHIGAARPVHMEILRVDRLARFRGDNALLVIIVREGFLRRQQRRAEHNTLRAKLQHLHQIAPAGHAARRQHRHVRDFHYATHDFGARNRAAHMPARFHTLRDQDLRARFLRVFRFMKPANLAHHQHAFAAQALHNLRRQIPEQADNRHARGQHRFDLRFEQIGLCGGGNKIDAEIAIRLGAHFLDFRIDEVRRLAHHAEETEASRPRHRRDEFAARRTAHAGQHDGKFAAQKIADGRMQLRIHAFFLAFFVFRAALVFFTDFAPLRYSARTTA